MKMYFFLVVACAFLSISWANKRDFQSAKDNLAGINEAVKRVKELHEYLQSEEFQKIVHDIDERINHAPEVAVKCFKDSTDASKEDRDVIAKRIQDTLNRAFKGGNDETTNPLQRLRNLVTALVKILGDKDLQKDIIAVDEQYEDAVKKAFQCYEEEVNSIAEEIENTVESIEVKFLGHKL